MQIRVKISYSTARGYYVDLPTYMMIAGTMRPRKNGVTDGDAIAPDLDPDSTAAKDLTVEVICPDEYVNEETGRIDKRLIREMYEGSTAWDKHDRDWSTVDEASNI